MAATVRQRHESDRSTGFVGSAHSRLTCQLRVTFLAEGGRMSDGRGYQLRIHDS